MLQTSKMHGAGPAWQVEHLRVDVETCSTLSAGQTVADIWHQSGQAPNVHVCMVGGGVDVPWFGRCFGMY